MIRLNPFRNFALKIVSAFIAFLLWLIVAGEQPAERGLRIPLELQNLPPNIEVVDLPIETVDVRVRGPSGTLSRLGQGDLVAVLDLQSARPGPRLFHVTPEQVHAPFGVEVSQVSPPTLALRFETSASRIVPVAPAVVGEVAAGYVVSKVTTEPATVEVVGPQSVISQISEALTEPVSVEGATNTVREPVTVGAASPNVRLKMPQRAMVAVTVVPAPVEKTLERVPVHLRNVTSNLTAQSLPPVVNVRVRGSQAALGSLRSTAVNAFVDLSGLGPGVYELPVRVDRTTSFGVAGMQPAVVQIFIE
jgi:YbbR domain-containing protein